MDLLNLKRHMPSIEDGRWVTPEELPALVDVQVKVRGAEANAGRALFAAKARAIDPKDKTARGQIKPEAMQRLLAEVLAEWHLVEIEGLTMGGKPIGIDEVRKLLLAPEFQPFADVLMQAVAIVDATREADIESLSGN
jgi:hypothetical protein